ncbi:Glycerol kinase [compost metagenome]
MEDDSGIELTKLRVDGGVVKNDFLMQFQSDMLGVTVERPVINETTALGAAYLAGLAVGFWQDQAEIAAQWQVDRAFEQEMEAELQEKLYNGWKKAVNAAIAFK